LAYTSTFLKVAKSSTFDNTDRKNSLTAYNIECALQSTKTTNRIRRIRVGGGLLSCR